MSAVVLLEWKFSPHDYFEEVCEISHQDYTVTIGNGEIQARIDPTVYDADPAIRDRLHNDLHSRFLGVQVVTHRPFELSRSGMSRVHPDGRRDRFLEVRIEAKSTTGAVDVQIIDKDRNIIRDSKRERIDEEQKYAALVSAHSGDTILASLLQSNDKAANDPENELVYLYEIRNALSTNFGDDRKARTALSITKSQWSRFGNLCNNEPLRQGRHRGEALGISACCEMPRLLN
jgi:hypothetical protein